MPWKIIRHPNTPDDFVEIDAGLNAVVAEHDAEVGGSAIAGSNYLDGPKQRPRRTTAVWCLGSGQHPVEEYSVGWPCAAYGVELAGLLAATFSESNRNGRNHVDAAFLRRRRYVTMCFGIFSLEIIY